MVERDTSPEQRRRRQRDKDRSRWTVELRQLRKNKKRIIGPKLPLIVGPNFQAQKKRKAEIALTLRLGVGMATGRIGTRSWVPRPRPALWVGRPETAPPRMSGQHAPPRTRPEEPRPAPKHTSPSLNRRKKNIQTS